MVRVIDTDTSRLCIMSRARYLAIVAFAVVTGVVLAFSINAASGEPGARDLHQRLRALDRFERARACDGLEGACAVRVAALRRSS